MKASHETTQPPWPPPGPCEGVSSFLGKFSSSEVNVKRSMTKVNMSIDGEYERELARKAVGQVLRWMGVQTFKVGLELGRTGGLKDK